MIDVFASTGGISHAAAARAGLEGGFPMQWLRTFTADPSLADRLAHRLAHEAFGTQADALMADLALR
jgi:hypothetical protein